MKVLVLNGIQEGYVQEQEVLENILKNKFGQDVTIERLREKTIGYCVGCWDCWLKTPGKCRIKDDQEDILKKFIHSDLVIYISPMILGYINALTKNTLDRIIPIAHPYITLRYNESHHLQRYENVPDVGVILLCGNESNEQDIQGMYDYFDRVSLNFNCQVLIKEAISTQGGFDHVVNCLERLTKR